MEMFGESFNSSSSCGARRGVVEVAGLLDSHQSSSMYVSFSRPVVESYNIAYWPWI
jgi:hypothetical protein